MKLRWLAAVAVLAVGACSTPAQQTDLQSPTSATSTATSPTVSADEQAVLDAYDAFYVALDAARKDPTKAREILTPVAAGEQLEQTTAKLVEADANGIEEYGSPVLRSPVVASLQDDTAVIRDCQDTSQVGSRQRATGEQLSKGLEQDSARTTLHRTNGVWKVVSTESPEPAGVYC